MTYEDLIKTIKLGDHIFLQNPDDACSVEEACVNELFKDGIGVLIYAKDNFTSFYAEVYKGELEHVYCGHVSKAG